MPKATVEDKTGKVSPPHRGERAPFRDFLTRPATIAFLAFTALYAACMAFIFWGTWALDKAPVEPDNPITYAINDGAKWFADVCAGGRFIPSDLMHVIGGMYFWQELQYALAAYLAALGVVFYLRGRRVPLVGAYGGGAAFGLMGYCFTLFSAGHLGWFIWLMYGPFAFGLVDRCVRKGKWRNWALLGVVLAWSSAQQPDMWLLFTALTFAYGVWCLVRERRALRWGRLFAGVGIAAAVMFATGLPQFRRALVQDLAGRDQQIAESSGGKADASGKDGDAAREERWRFCTNWSLPPEDTLEFIAAEVHGGSNDPRVSPHNPYTGRLGQQDSKGDWHPFRQHSLYLGIVTVFFAILGVVGWWKRRTTKYSDVPFWVVAALIVYLCALGRFTPFYRLVFALPFGDYLRAPVKFVHLLELCTAVLAGFGFAWIQERFGATRAWVGGVLCVLAVVNVIDLARVDGKYLAVEDVSFQKAPNDAAEDITKLNGGKVFFHMPMMSQQEAMSSQAKYNEAMRQQNDMRRVRESLGVHLAEVANVPQDEKGKWNVPFVLVSREVSRQIKQFLRARNQTVETVGGYTLSFVPGAGQGIRRTDQKAPKLELLHVKDVPVTTPEPTPPDRVAQMLTLLSVLMTVGVGAWTVAAVFVEMKKAKETENE